MKQKQKKSVKMILRHRNCTTLTDVRTVIFLTSQKERYSKFPNRQRVLDAVFNSNLSWQKRKAWIDRIIDWKGDRGENLEWQTILHNSKEKALQLKKNKTDRMTGSKNPAYNHAGKFSVFSEKFVGKTTKNSAIEKMKSTMKNNPQNQTTKIEYYIERGMSKEEALIALKSRQAVGSLDKFIERYGEFDGKKRWADRQKKWQKTLQSKPEKEIARINSLKLGNGYSVSKAEKELYEKLTQKIDVKRNLSLPYNKRSKYFVYDIYYKDKIIEYNGDFWHANPKLYDVDFYNPVSKLNAKEIWEKEQNKDNVAYDHGYSVHKVWERDYKENPDKVIEECINFLTQ